MERIVRSNSKRQAKYSLLKFEDDNKTAIYSTSTLIGKAEVGERCKAFYRRKEWFGIILAMNGRLRQINIEIVFVLVSTSFLKGGVKLKTFNRSITVIKKVNGK